MWYAARLAFGEEKFDEVKSLLLKEIEKCIETVNAHGDIDWSSQQVKIAANEILKTMQTLDESNRSTLQFRFDGSPMK